MVAASQHFVLIPAAHDDTFTSVEPPGPRDYTEPAVLPGGHVWLGKPEVPLRIQFLVGHGAFGSPDAALLVLLLPQLVHVQGEARLATLVEMVGTRREARGRRATSYWPGCWRCF